AVQRQMADFGVRLDLEGHTTAEVVAFLFGKTPITALLAIRHASADVRHDRDVARLPMDEAVPAHLDVRTLQKRLRDEAPSIYLYWPDRLEVIDRRFCGLPKLPFGPETQLNLVHPCAEGEVE